MHQLRINARSGRRSTLLKEFAPSRNLLVKAIRHACSD
jgi:hypothetical protein